MGGGATDLLNDILELIQHAIEAGGHVADLVFTGDIDATGQIRFSFNGTHGLFQQKQRFREAVSEKEARCQEHHENNGDGGREDTVLHF